MADSVEISIAGEPVRLYADRALYWPARRRLLIADLHLGKADTFRGAGIALPSGGTRADLQRLSVLVAASGATSLWILGDVLHASPDESRWREAWTAWRDEHRGLSIGAIAGNHDRALQRAALEIDLLGDAVEDGPYTLRHMPQTHPTRHTICGHIHPVRRLPGIARRLPVFWLQPRCTVLPAFSLFTSGYEPDLDARDRYVVCAPGAAIEIGA